MFLNKLIFKNINLKSHKNPICVLGGWPVIRRELLKRNWIEKYDQGNKLKFNNIEDVTSNLPAKQEWESPANYVEKCERTGKIVKFL